MRSLRLHGAFISVLATLLVGAAGCGPVSTAGSSAHASPASQLVVDPGRVTPSAGGSASGAANPVPTRAAGQSSATHAQPSPAPSAPQFAPGTTEAPATATLSAACLTTAGQQTLRVHSRPTYAVTYDAQYSDYGDGQKYGGVGTGHLDNNGDFVASWIVQPGAPPGNVIVWVSVAGGSESAFRQPTFVVASSC